MSDYMKENLKADIKDAKKDGDKDLEKRLKDDLANLNSEMKTLRESHQAEKDSLTSNHKKELLNKDLKFKLFSRSDIATESVKDRHFARNFMADFDEYVAKQGIVINADTLELQKTDGTPFYTKTNDALDLDGLMGIVVKDYGYEKKSDEVKKEIVSVEEGEGLTAAQKANLKRSSGG